MTSKERYKWACTTPSDIAEHVPTLRAYANKCESVAEFGVRGAVSTSAWLAANVKRLHCYDILVPECLDELKAIAKSIGCRFSFTRADTGCVVIEKKDLLFVDTLHTADHLSNELFNNHHNVSKFIILHDTELNGWAGENGGHGLKHALMEFLLVSTQWRIEKHWHHSNGLTILSRLEGS